ncbi:CBS domain-containing protein [Pseudonocardia sp. KRD-182]|uniref:CBS domain-containing protein n=1 Tax=Pseudonocardia oceani TaxID=2792013 RepID=UPI001C4A1147|nr:CBS domain-containing protein [Pseudonocardia oceani]MBW0111826.1 CBS domain-containing protein [Pseudonocardia oceani]
MTTGVLSVGPDAAFTEVARALSTGAVRAVPVLDQEGRLLGVVSEADLLATAERAEPRQDRPWWRYRPRHTHRTGPQAKVGAGTARELMSAPAVTVGPRTTVARAARTMREHGLSWMPVVGPDGRVVGVLGRSDLLAVFLRSDAEIRTEVVDEVLGRMLLVDPTGISVEASDGVVTLSGEIDTRTDAILAVRFVERMEGVVEVVDRLRHRVDDRVATLPIDPLY